MFDDNHIDDLMKSILDSGREDVPEHVWKGVSAGLDKAARRKAVVVWFRRAGAFAAAAAVAVGVMLNIRQEEVLVPESSDNGMIAVVEKTEEKAMSIQDDTMLHASRNLVAYTKPISNAGISSAHDMSSHDHISSATADENPSGNPADMTSKPAAADHEVKTTDDMTETDAKDTAPDTGTWIEDETGLKERKMKTSIVLSSIAGTNNPQNKGGSRPLRSPAMERKYTRSTMEQVGPETSYGVPFSAGIGVRMKFTERWSLGMGVNYSLLTTRFNGRYIEVKDGVESLPVPGKVSNTQHYIGIPINVYYNIVSHDFINFYAYAGGTVEKCVANRYQMQASPVINHSENVKGVQLSVDAGIGVEFMLSRYAGIYIDPSLRYYFRNGQPKSIRTAQPLMLGFEVGLRFNL